MDFVRAVASLDFVSERGLNSDYEYKGWLAIVKLKPLTLFISLF